MRIAKPQIPKILDLCTPAPNHGAIFPEPLRLAIDRSVSADISRCYQLLLQARGFILLIVDQKSRVFR